MLRIVDDASFISPASPRSMSFWHTLCTTLSTPTPPPPPVLSQRSSDFCPNHHRHADELDRVARADPHVQFFDYQGHRAERLIRHEVLQSMYPAEPPSDAEIMDPKYDHTPPPYQP